MSSILDQLLDSYAPPATPARMVREQHDVSKIAVGEAPRGGGKPSDGLRRQLDSLRNGGWWDAAEYGISREAQAAQLETALAKAEAYEASPEGMEKARQEAERALAEMRDRAIRRAGLDTAGGRVRMFAARDAQGRAPWHQLGVLIDKACNSIQAIQFAGLDREVEKVPLFFLDPNDKEVQAPGLYGLMYSDTGTFLTRGEVIGERYEPIQNRDAFAFLDGVLKEHGARYETAGSIHGGKKVWILAHLPQQRFTVNGNDVTEPYVMFSNTHGGEMAYCFPTTERTVCANTYRTAMGRRKGKGLCIRHTGDIKAKIRAAQEALGLAVQGFEDYRQAAEAMTTAKVQPKRYFGDVLDEIITFTEAEQALQAGKGTSWLETTLKISEAEAALAGKSLDSKLKRRGEMLEVMLEVYEERTNGVRGMRGTAWAAFNAATEVADHRAFGRQPQDQRKRLERRFESVIDGEADDLKQAAYRVATAAIN